MRAQPPRTPGEKLGQLEARREESRGSNPNARRRIEKLLDPGSFEELDGFVRHRTFDFGLHDNRPWGDAVVTGHGTIEGRRVCVFAQDSGTFGGSLGEAMAEKICKAMDLAARIGCPVIGINDSGGARIQEGVVSLAGYGEVFARNVRCSGVIPQISLIMGPCAGGAVYSPAMTDFILMVKGTSQMFVTGPEVIRTVTGQEVGLEELGGAMAHNARSGVAHFACEDEDACIADTRRLLSFLPQSNLQPPPRTTTDDPRDRTDPELDGIVPDSHNQGYDMREVIGRVVDEGDFLEVQEHFATNMVVGFARVDGRPIGIYANQPCRLAGVVDIGAAEKAARFVRFCDAFNIPLVAFTDVPGFLPGTGQEWGGIIRHGAKLAYATIEATVPKIAIVTRKAYGGGYGVMGSKRLLTDVNLAWPQGEIAVMGAEGAVSVIHRREIAAAADPDARGAELIEEYRTRFANPYAAAGRGLIDDVILPRETRPRLIAALEELEHKQVEPVARKHGNIPL